MSNWLELQDKVVLVTGGAAGLGREFGIRFASVGAQVAVADVSDRAGKALLDELEGGSDRHLYLHVDVTDPASVVAMTDAAIERFGRIDVLINNAGISAPRLLVDPAGEEELSVDLWDKVVAVNQKGPFLCAQAVARTWIRDGRQGVIINMASESGLEGSEGQSAYAATKAALYSLTRSWAKELGKHGIRVVGMAPGIIESTALRNDEYERALAYTRGETVEEMQRRYADVSIPMGRPGRLTEIADTALFLASERAAYIHGTVLNISGGKSRA